MEICCCVVNTRTLTELKFKTCDCLVLCASLVGFSICSALCASMNVRVLTIEFQQKRLHRDTALTHYLERGIINNLMIQCGKSWRRDNTVRQLSILCTCVCVGVCVRACVRACVCVNYL